MAERTKELSPFYKALTKAMQVFSEATSDSKTRRNAFDSVLRKHEEELHKAREFGYSDGAPYPDAGGLV